MKDTCNSAKGVENARRILIGKPQGWGLFGRQLHICEDNIKIGS